MEEIFVKSRNIWNSYMKNLNMLFNNKLPTNLYTTFRIIKLLIKKRNLNLIHNKKYISTLYIYFHQVKHYIHDFILYTRNFLQKNEKQILHNGWGVSMKINSENENYILHFMFSYKYFTYQIIKNPCNGKRMST